jgi:hypothetical protein
MRGSMGRMALAMAACVALSAGTVRAAVVCQKGQKLKLRVSACKAKEVQVHDLAEIAQPGPTGPTGPTGAPGTARAYAEVDVATPSFVTARTNGFASVSRTGTGIYCVVPEAPVDPATNPAVVSASGPLNSNALAYTAPSSVACTDGYVVAVKAGIALDDATNFTIIVP